MICLELATCTAPERFSVLYATCHGRFTARLEVQKFGFHAYAQLLVLPSQAAEFPHVSCRLEFTTTIAVVAT